MRFHDYTQAAESQRGPCINHRYAGMLWPVLAPNVTSNALNKNARNQFTARALELNNLTADEQITCNRRIPYPLFVPATRLPHIFSTGDRVCI